MAYDSMGNYTGEDSTEELTASEKQRQQDAMLAQMQAQKQELAPPTAGPAVQPIAPVQPPQMVPAPAVPQAPPPGVPPQGGPVAPQQPQRPAPPPGAPVAPPGANYNAYTAQQESGNNPNIGYHDPSKGSAYGTFGLTKAAYKDIQAANPAFQGRDITTLTPEEQAQANTTYQGILGSQLKNLNVEPSEANTRLAHFLGAKGAADYLSTGAVSPQAAATNGGEANVRKIAEGRLAGGASPASGATMAGMPGSSQAGPPEQLMDQQGWTQRFQTATQDPKMLAALRNDEAAPAWVRQAAASADYEQLKMQKDTIEAQNKFKDTIQNGNWTGLASELKKDTNDGSIFKAMFYKSVGLNDLAAAEQGKLGAGRTWQSVTLPDGKAGVVQVGADGAPVQGYTEAGQMEPTQMAEAIGMTFGGTAGKLAETGKSLYTDPEGATWTMTTVPGRAGAVWKNATTGKVSMTAPVGLRPLSQETADQKSNSTMLTKMLKANADAASVGAPPIYSEVDVNNARSAASNPMVSAQATQGAQGRPPMPPPPGSPPQGPVAPGGGMPPGPMAPQGMRPQGGPPPGSAQDQSPAAKIARYEMPMPAASRNSPADIAIRNQVYAMNPTYDGTKYDVNKKVVEDYTSGKSSQTLVNIGTAANHLTQYRNIAQEIGGTDNSSWNSFYQNLQKYGNAPEIKSKAAMSQFVAGEMVKAATGGEGGQAERDELIKKLNSANTPKEITRVIDDQLKLSHGRYASMKTKYESSTGRKDFDTIAGLAPEAKEAFDKIDKGEAASSSSNPFAAELARRKSQQGGG